MLERHIIRGTKFTGSSKGEIQEWVVTRRIKTEVKNMIYTVCPATGQERKYTGHQFGFLLRRGIVHLA